MPATAIPDMMQHQHQFEAIHLGTHNLLYHMYLGPSMSQLLINSSADSTSVKSQVVPGGHSGRKLCTLNKRWRHHTQRPNVVLDPACQLYCVMVRAGAARACAITASHFCMGGHA